MSNIFNIFNTVHKTPIEIVIKFAELATYSSKIRSNIGVQANNLQKLIDTPTNYFDVELLRKAFEDKFQFYIKRKDIKEDQHIFIPKNIYFKKGNKKISYEKLYKTYN